MIIFVGRSGGLSINVVVIRRLGGDKHCVVLDIIRQMPSARGGERKVQLIGSAVDTLSMDIAPGRHDPHPIQGSEDRRHLKARAVIYLI